MNISGWGQNFRMALPASVITPQNHVAAAQAHLAAGDPVNAEESYKAAIQLAKAELAKKPGHAREVALARISAEYAAFLARENASDASSLQQPSASENNSVSAAHRSSFSSYPLPFPIQASTEGKIVVQNCQGTINAPVHGKNNTVNVYYSPNLEARQPHAASLANLRHAFHRYYDKTSNLSIQRVSGQTVSLDDCYINLAIVESQAQKEKDQVELKKQAAAFERLPSSERLKTTNPNKLIPLDQLFEKQRLLDGSEGIPKRILIQGRAGIGKTTLCKKLVYEYHHNGLWQDRFDSVLWMPLRQLKTHSPQHLEDLLCQRYFADQGRVKAQALGKTFLEYQGKTLFILDGLDEVTEMFDERHRLNHFLNHLLNQAHVLITSRPAGVNASQCNELDLELETIGFSPENVQTYIQKFTPESNQEAIQQFIHRTPLIQSLVNIPIQLDALCYSWDKLPKNQAITMSMLYEAMVDKLWRKDSVRLEKKEGGKVLRADVIEDLSEADLEELMMAEIDYLGYLAFKGLEEEKIEFSREELSQRRQELNNIRSQTEGKLPLDFTTNLKKTSYLHTADTERPESERHYHFLHLTFQEFFAAKFLAKHLQAYLKVERVLAHFVQNDLGALPQRNEVEAFIATHKYNPRYEIVWWMVAGLLKGAALENFFHVLAQSPRDLIGGHHQQIMMGCLNEARAQLKATTLAQLEKEFMQWLNFELKNGQSTYSHLGSQRVFPEPLLLKGLSLAVGEGKNGLMETLGARPALSIAAIRALISSLKDNDKSVRSAAARALGHQNGLSSAAVQALISSLKDENWDVSYAASNTLGSQNELPADAVQTLISYLKDERGNVRSAASSILGRQKKLPDGAVQALISYLKDEDEDVRNAAASALGSQNDLSDDAVQTLIFSLMDENTDVSYAAAYVLGSRNGLSAGAVQDLISSLTDCDDSAMKEVARALSSQSELTANAVRALILSLTDIKSSVKEAAAHTLGSQNELSANAIQALISCLLVKDCSVREAAVHALGNQNKLSANAIQALISCLLDEDCSVRGATVRVLGSQNELSDDTIQALIPCLLDEDWNVREAAARALGNQNVLPADAVQELTASLRDYEDSVRIEAARALSSQNELSANSVRALILSLRDGKWSVREAAARALGNQNVLSADAVRPLIFRSLKDISVSVRSAATFALGVHINQLFTLLASLEKNQVKTLYTKVFFPRSCEEIISLTIQNNQLHFYTATGPGQSIHLSADQSEMITEAFKSVQAEVGLI